MFHPSIGVGVPLIIQWDGGLGGTPISSKGWRGRGYPSFTQQGDRVLLFNPVVENRQYSYFSQWSGRVEGTPVSANRKGRGTPVSSNMGSTGTSVSPNKGDKGVMLVSSHKGGGG